MRSTRARQWRAGFLAVLAAGQAAQKGWELSQFPCPAPTELLPTPGETSWGLNTLSCLGEPPTRAHRMGSDLGANDVLVRFDVSQCVVVLLLHRAHGVQSRPRAHRVKGAVWREQGEAFPSAHGDGGRSPPTWGNCYNYEAVGRGKLGLEQGWRWAQALGKAPNTPESLRATRVGSAEVTT